MQAAVVTEFGSPPSYATFADPVAASDDELVVDVLAAGLHPLVRSRASGAHYSSEGVLPLVPGTDGVGRDGEGRLRYFHAGGSVGSMAQRTVVDLRRSTVLPDGTDPVSVAAGMNPVMASWVALRRRITFQAGQQVLVLGATGAAGQAAVQVARLFGASRIVAAGRNAATLAILPGLGATDVVSLAEPAEHLAETSRNVDVVIDFLWGQPAADTLRALAPLRHDDARPLTWVQIGAMAGGECPLPSAALRSTPLTVVGSGIGSVSPAGIVAELPAIAASITAGDIRVPARPVPLADVTRAWVEAPTSRDRIVLVP